MIERTDVSGWAVLIVDDHPDSLVITELTLGAYGAQVRTASSVEQAFAILESFQPTFILLDLSMPMIDGWSMLESIRQNRLLANIPVIAVTAHAMSGDEERVLAAGFDGYISKPFSPVHFVNDLISLFNEDAALADRVQRGLQHGTL